MFDFNRQTKIAAVIILFLQGNLAFAKTWEINSAQQLNAISKQVHGGDEIVWANGSYTDQDIVFRSLNQNEDALPITLRAQSPGKVRFTGSSRLRIKGNHLIVSGFDFYGGSIPSQWVILFDEETNHCRLTQTRIHDKNGDGHKAKWVVIYGENHEIDNNTFTKKTVEDNLMTVRLDGIDPVKGANHHIHQNYFADRPQGTDKNGWEILRVGDSKTSMQAARVVVEKNLFEKCDGEIEVISNKSCFNRYENNTFVNCKGQLTLRHGNDCIVRDNVFMGNGHELNSGIRVIGQRHLVEGNHLEKLGGEEYRGSLVLVNGMKDGPLHGYAPVKDCVIKNNLIIKCRYPIEIGVQSSKGNTPISPTDTLLEGNIIIDPLAVGVVRFLNQNQGHLVWKNNYVTGMELTQKLVRGNESPFADDAFYLLKKDPSQLREASLKRLKPLDHKDVGALWVR